MKSRIIGSLFVAAASAALITGPLVSVASAEVVSPAQQAGPAILHEDGDWGGFNQPGWLDPRDPWHNDWHCDRHGRWHDDERDGWGRHDDRCHEW
ncbi:hypothetical protein [Nocardia sp. NPDC020380]|uniref:hypothetical protein n=1 Tax=Nocardia sp. NPDC020380 TaxID=3364309 RepID=UPI0037A3F0AE